MDDVPNYCTNYGESLADAERVLDYVTQVVSIPELKPVIKEIRHYVMICKKCGERGIRKLKIMLKNSCTFRSDFGADAFLELHSIVETAKKHNQTPFNAIQALFKV